MADALCGPSNPLQNLQKHTQIDRTLQQDRLVSSRQSPGQGFRTADPRAGSADADFYAFENAAPSPFQFEQPNFAHGGPAFAPQSPAASAAWAADFQRLNLHDQPLPAGQFRTEAPLIKSTIGGWQNEFMRQRSSASTPVAQGKQAVREAPQMNMFGASQQMNYTGAAYQSYGGGMGMGMGMYQDGAFQQQAQHPPQMSMSMEQNVQLADVDFDAAFQEAVAHAQEMDQLRGVTDNSGLENAATADLQQDQQPLSEGIRIGSDAIQYKEQADRTADQDAQDADELARTAGQLLHSVQHDTSTKFQNSQFLDLMRKLRDREVEVANNDLQFVSTSTNLNGEETTTSNQLFSATEHHQQNQEQSAHNDQEQLDAGHFEFPDMDSVYRPDGPTKQTFDSTITPFLHAPPYTTYGFEDDQFPQQTARQPQRQTDELHPGGRWYPDQSPVMSTAQSATAAPENGDGGSLENRMSTSEFEYTDESGNLARRFVR